MKNRKIESLLFQAIYNEQRTFIMTLSIFSIIIIIIEWNFILSICDESKSGANPNKRFAVCIIIIDEIK